MLFIIVVALVATYLISRLVGLVAKRWPDTIGKAVSVNAVSAIIAVAAGAWASAADGGQPKFYLAFLIYGGLRYSPPSRHRRPTRVRLRTAPVSQEHPPKEKLLAKDLQVGEVTFSGRRSTTNSIRSWRRLWLMEPFYS